MGRLGRSTRRKASRFSLLKQEIMEDKWQRRTYSKFKRREVIITVANLILPENKSKKKRDGEKKVGGDEGGS